jgi:hypothetical protein
VPQVQHLRSITHVRCITSSGLRSSVAVEEEGLIAEILQCDSVRRVEFTLTHRHDSKRGSQAREKRT